MKQETEQLLCRMIFRPDVDDDIVQDELIKHRVRAARIIIHDSKKIRPTSNTLPKYGVFRLSSQPRVIIHRFAGRCPYSSKGKKTQDNTI
jgi:hypothetical protein